MDDERSFQWEQFKLLVETNRAYVDIVIKTTAIYGGISAAILGLFTKGVDWQRLTFQSEEAPRSALLSVSAFGLVFGLIFLIAVLRAIPVAQTMDHEMRRLAEALQIRPKSHVGVLFLALGIALLMFAAAVLVFGTLTTLAVQR